MNNYSARPRRVSNPVTAALLAAGLGLWGSASANHTVLVEGEKDFDGDGVFGAAEDSDGDQVYGSINGGVAGVGGNGKVVIVTSGRFFEQVDVSPAGVFVLEAAPGVDATVEAFNAGDDPAANNRRQRQAGIIIRDGDFPVEIRNIVSRNWTIGIQVRNMANVTLDNVTVDSNVNYGILVENSRVVIDGSQVNSSGFRASGTLGPTPGGDVPPRPGIGIEFANNGKGFVANTTVAHSFAAGISNEGSRNAVQLQNNVLFNNNPDLDGFSRRRGD